MFKQVSVCFTFFSKMFVLGNNSFCANRWKLFIAIFAPFINCGKVKIYGEGKRLVKKEKEE